MADDFIEIKIDNQEVNKRLLDLATKGENLRPLMKNIAGIFAYSTEENFKNEGRPKWQDLAESTKKQRQKKNVPNKFYRLKVNLQVQLILITTTIQPLSVQILITLQSINSADWQVKTNQPQSLQEPTCN